MKKISFLFLISLLIFLSAGFVFAQRDLEVPLPGIGGQEIKTTPLLPDYIKYIFNFAIAISGLLSFGVLVFAGFRYMASAGNPTIASDARDQIFSALIGLLVILGSYLILTTVNPQLIIINPQAAGMVDGITLEDSQGKKITYRVSQGDLGDFQAVKYEILSSLQILEVIAYPDKGWGGTGVPLNTQTGPLSFPKSIKLNWKAPGIYLCLSETECDGPYGADVISLNSRINDKASYIKFINPSGTKYGAVLHSDRYLKGDCEIILSAENQILFPITNLNKRASSISIFRQDAGISSGNITLCENSDCQKTNKEDTAEAWRIFSFDQGQISGIQSKFPKLSDYSYENGDTIDVGWKGDGLLGFQNRRNTGVSALKIENYLAILYRDPNYGGICEVFSQSDPNLDIDNAIGNDQASSMIIIKGKK